MKKLVQVSFLIALGALTGAAFFGAVPEAGAGEDCYNCGTGSSANQCKTRGKDTFERRKVCEAAGCKISGTGMCSTASNVKVIDPG